MLDPDSNPRLMGAGGCLGRPAAYKRGRRQPSIFHVVGPARIPASSARSFATADPELVLALDAALPGISVVWKDRVNFTLNRVKSPGDVVTLENPVTGALRALDLLGTRSNSKFVPDDYLHNSAEV